MIPGMNSRQMKQAMKKMGIAQQEVAANEVIIRCDDKEIVITNPQVSKVNMMGQQTYQVVGEAIERELDTTPEINNEDVETVMDSTGSTEDEARTALEESKGDLAQAIMNIKGE